jgi:diaminohydroxyphosphoribosylaminopyrimidine deaminase/5-amino-6-(5-phosphoribosylamino)uracil reductase
LVEGGAHILRQFIEADLWDEARIIVSPIQWGEGLSAPILNGHLTQRFHAGIDEVRIFRPLLSEE